MPNLHFSRLWPGVPMAIGSAVLFGLATPLSKILLYGLRPQLLAGLLYLGAGVGLALLHFGRAAIWLRAPEAPLRKADLPWLIAVVLFGGVAGPLLLMLGLARTGAANASLLLNVESLATMGIAWVVCRENVDRRLLLGAFAILLGAVALSWRGKGFVLDGGGLLIGAACVAWGIDNNLTRKLSASDPVMIAMVKGLASGCINIVLAIAGGAVLPGVLVAGSAAILGFFGVGVSLVLFVLALRHIGTARTGAYFSFGPFIGAVAAVVLLHERITPELVIAGLLMGFGLWLHLTERHGHRHSHDVAEHEHNHVHDIHHQHAHEGNIVESHTHMHKHLPLLHEHAHYPELHHRHRHEED